MPLPAPPKNYVETKTKTSLKIKEKKLCKSSNKNQKKI